MVVCYFVMHYLFFSMNFPECVKCYSCGFMKKGDSETEALPGDVPFCNGELACFGSVKKVKIKTS